MEDEESGKVQVKAEGWKDALAGVYGDDGPEPSVLETGEKISPGPADGGEVDGNIARRKSED